MALEKKRRQAHSLTSIQRPLATNPFNVAGIENSSAYLHFRSACVFLFVSFVSLWFI
jgi:hypothetical protein